jgi:hypothetical protein
MGSSPKAVRRCGVKKKGVFKRMEPTGLALTYTLGVGDWTITFDKLFTKELMHWDDDFKDAALRARRKQVPELLGQRHVMEEEFVTFLGCLEKLTDTANPNPVVSLTALPGELGRKLPSVPILKSGGWSAVFLANEELKMLRGLFVFKGTLEPGKLLYLVSVALAIMQK